jgi:hypothetical protein
MGCILPPMEVLQWGLMEGRHHPMAWDTLAWARPDLGWGHQCEQQEWGRQWLIDAQHVNKTTALWEHSAGKWMRC